MNEVKELPSNRQNKTAMSIGNFTMIANQVLLDTRISYKARGIFCLILSRPQDWQIYVDELTSKSEKDGKRAVQSGLKELLEHRYIELAPTYDAKGRFKGTHYRVVQPSLFLNRRSGFKTVRKEDSPKTGQSENAVVLKLDSPKTASLTKTNSSNTNKSNTKQQQQEEKKSAAADFEISIFFEKILADKDWKSLFIGQMISDVTKLETTDLDVLLHHFKATAAKSGNRYADSQAVKKHFTNWFHANLKKGALVSYLETHHSKQRKMKNKVIHLIPKSDAIFCRLKGRKCIDLRHLHTSIKKLKEHHTLYVNALPYLEESQQKGITILVADIDNLLGKVERAKAKNQLMWFCGNAQTDQSVPPSAIILKKAEKRLKVLKRGIVPISPAVRKELVGYLKVVEPLSTPPYKQITQQIKQLLVTKRHRQQAVLQSA